MRLKESRYSRCIYYSSGVLSRVSEKIAGEEFQKIGLAPTYAYLLMTVVHQPGIRPGEISDELQLTPSTVTRLVQKMEEKGYLERISEGRATRVEPTKKCRDLKGDLEEAWQRLQDRFAEKLGERYKEVLAEMTFKAVEQL